MPLRKYFPLLLIVLGFLSLAALLALWPAQKANAQCGSQASSCKTCHETEGKDPVNNDGTGWHQSHSFGDFCYICHAGNSQSTVKEEAHAGLVDPLSDAKASCMSCHPGDLDARVQVYTAALGSGAGSGGSAPAATSAPAAATPEAQPTSEQPAATSAPAEPPASGSAPAAPAAPAEPPAKPAAQAEAPLPPGPPPGSGEVVNYSQRYDQVVSGQSPINWGNVVLVVLIVVLLLGGGALVYWNERRLRGGAAAAKTASQASDQPATPQVSDYPAEVAALLPMLGQLNPVGLASLQRMLQNPEQANEILHSLSNLDPAVVQRVRDMDPDTRALLMALAAG